MRRIGPIIVSFSALFYCFEFFIRVMPSVFATNIMTHFNIQATAFSLLSAAFFLSYVPMQIPAGMLGDRFGPRRILTAMTLLAGLSCIAFAHASLWQHAAIARALIGLGASFAYIAPLTLAARWLSARHFGLTAGLIQAVGCLGAVLGNAPLAALSDRIGWLQCINGAGYVGLALALMLCLVIRDGPDNEPSPSTPMMSTLKAIVRHPQSWIIALLGFAAWTPMSIFTELWSTPYFMDTFHLSLQEAAHDTSFIWYGVALGGPLLTTLSQKYRRRKAPLLLGLMLSLMAIVGLLYADVSLKFVPWLCFALGMGCSTQAVTFALVGDYNDEQSSGTASGFNNMAVILGGVIMQPLSGLLLDHFEPTATTHHYASHTFQHAFVLMPLTLMIGLLVACFFLKETHARSQL